MLSEKEVIEELLSDRAELQAEIERLKDERNKWKSRFTQLERAFKVKNPGEFIQIPYSKELEDERDRLQAENTALKKAAIEYCQNDDDENFYRFCCYSCKYVETSVEDDNCDICDDNYSGWELDFDRFKDGGERHD